MNDKAIFFDWDGTAVKSRKAPVEEVVTLMKQLLVRGVKLIIISGTTYEKIADGKIHQYFTVEELENLYLGLGRGAHNYSFENGNPVLHEEFLPDRDENLKIHECVFQLHQYLLREYGLDSDIIFTRPNYCKLDLMVNHDRNDSLFLQEGEIEMLQQILKVHGICEGIRGLMKLAEQMGKEKGVHLKATTDAKYLEIGLTTKSDNVDYFVDQVLKPENISITECSFWGDEFMYLDDGILGSDAYMMTEKTKQGSFNDVSELRGSLPEGVNSLGGGTKRFLTFLKNEIERS